MKIVTRYLATLTKLAVLAAAGLFLGSTLRADEVFSHATFSNKIAQGSSEFTKTTEMQAKGFVEKIYYLDPHGGRTLVEITYRDNSKDHYVTGHWVVSEGPKGEKITESWYTADKSDATKEVVVGKQLETYKWVMTDPKTVRGYWKLASSKAL